MHRSETAVTDMKTLILNGSPHVNGDTASLIQAVRQALTGDILQVDAYRYGISPCVDCRFCWENSGCAIQDRMKEIYEFLPHCDNVLIASPIYFSELTGKLLDVGSRLQTYFCAKYFRHKDAVGKPKKGAVLLVGGGDGRMEKAYDTACTLLRHLNCQTVHPLVCSHNTNHRPAIRDEQALAGARSIARFFCSLQSPLENPEIH